jgi:arabinofuranan 3-O-arabinosyltransferase
MVCGQTVGQNACFRHENRAALRSNLKISASLSGLLVEGARSVEGCAPKGFRMAAPVSAPDVSPDRTAIPAPLFNGAFILFVVVVTFFPAAWFSHLWIFDPNGLGSPTDFVNVWAAGRLALEGHPAQAWDWDIQKPIEVAELGQSFIGYFAWHYPPPFLFVASLLARFPYGAAFAGWVIVSVIPYLVVMRAIVGRPFGWMLALAVPTVISNGLVGQNGFITAALIGGTLYLIPVRPLLAGICLGLLIYKPQYGLLFPLVLIATAHWRVFFSAAVTTVSMAVVSWLAFGTESWQAFFHWMPVFSQAFLVEGKATWWKLQSLFSLVRFLGGTEQLAWMFQWALSAAVAVVLVVMWRSRISYSLKAAALATGTLLITPYLFMYDIMVLAIAVGFLVRIGLRTGFLPYELPALGCAAALIFCFIGLGAPLGLGSTVIVASLIMRRAAPWRRETVPSLASVASA